MKNRLIPIVLILAGLALFLGALFFLIDKSTSASPPGLGGQIIEILVLLIGAGSGIKGWLDLRKNPRETIRHSKNQRTQDLIDSPNSEQTMEGKGGIQKQKAVRSEGSKQNMK
ncbi:MAG TPA: hypothetical protein DCY14_11070 [Anaerolineae bacterium]|nr:hypothetical protein [Anaerolineae bacterium]HRJ56870.1 phage holin family protein [Anaerolineales bacterium]